MRRARTAAIAGALVSAILSQGCGTLDRRAGETHLREFERHTRYSPDVEALVHPLRWQFLDRCYDHSGGLQDLKEAREQIAGAHGQGGYELWTCRLLGDGYPGVNFRMGDAAPRETQDLLSDY